MAELKKHLESTRVNQISHPNKILRTVSSNTTLEETIQILAEEDILSVPVYDPESSNYLGFVDVLDIVFAIIKIYSNATEDEAICWSPWADDLKTLSLRGVRFAVKPVKNVIDMSKADPYLPVSPNGTLFQLIEEIFCKGFHRAPIVEENIPIGLVTQSDILFDLSNNMHLLGPLAQQSLQSLNMGTKSVIQMSSEAQSIIAFHLMYQHKVSAVAIVGKQGELLANLSASDIRGISHDNFGCLLKPIFDFVRNRKEKVKAPVTCKLDSTLETVIMKLSIFRIHRLWIVDDADRPIGVLSLTDIMKLLASL